MMTQCPWSQAADWQGPPQRRVATVLNSEDWAAA